jgi:K+-sensing histidine kinase KdpD
MRTVDRLLDTLPLPACVSLDSAAMVATNKRWRRLIGDASGSWIALAHDDDRTDATARWEAMTRHGGSSDFDARVLTREGGYRLQAVRVTPLGGLGLRAWLVVLSDISEADAARGRLAEILGFISHETKGLLTTIHGNARFMADRYDSLTEEQKRRGLTDLLHEAGRMWRMTEGLTALARTEGKEPPRLEPVAVLPIVRDAVHRHTTVHPARSVRLKSPEFLPRVVGVTSYVEEILTNFLDNAEHYSPSPSTPIDVVVDRQSKTVDVRVLDRGVGIDPTQTNRLFAPWERGHATSQATGTGFGLAVCRRLTELQGGEIWARPRDQGGAEFGVRLQRAHVVAVPA